MQQSKLIRLLKMLSPDEFRLFYKFIRSIYYQNNAKLVSLYEYLRKYYPDFSSEKMKKEKVFQKLFPRRTFNADSLAALMTKMTRLLEEYLLILDLRSDAFQRKRHLVRIYRKRKQFDFFEKGTKELLEELEKAPFPNHKEKIDLYNSLYFHPLHNKYDLEDESLEKLVESLDHYFALAKIRYGIALKNKQKILSKPYEWKFREGFKQEQGFIKSPILYQLYQHAYALLEEKAGVDFHIFEQLFFENTQHFDREDNMLIYFTGLNYINRQVNTGKTVFSSIAFKWYQLGLGNGLLIVNQQIDETTFGNIVVYGCREKQFDWTKDFIESYQIYLNAEIRADVLTHNLAFLLFSMREFDQVLSILRGYHFPEKDQPKIRLTMIRTMFELFLQDHDYYEVLTSNIHSFEMFILRNTLFNKHTLTPYLNCIRIIKGLATKISGQENKDRIRVWMLNQTASRLRVIASRWLLEKVEEL